MPPRSSRPLAADSVSPNLFKKREPADNLADLSDPRAIAKQSRLGLLLEKAYGGPHKDAG